MSIDPFSDRCQHWAEMAEQLGFAGGMETCPVYREKTQGHGEAINVIQPLAIIEEATARN